LRRARDLHERGVAGVEVGEVADLIGHEGAAGASALRPFGDARLEEEAVDDQLPAPVEQVEQAGLATRALEDVLLVDGQPRHSAPLGGQRVAGARHRLLLDQQLVARGVPLLAGHDRRGVHLGFLLVAISM